MIELNVNIISVFSQSHQQTINLELNNVCHRQFMKQALQYYVDNFKTVDEIFELLKQCHDK